MLLIAVQPSLIPPNCHLLRITGIDIRRRSRPRYTIYKSSENSTLQITVATELDKKVRCPLFYYCASLKTETTFSPFTAMYWKEVVSSTWSCARVWDTRNNKDRHKWLPGNRIYIQLINIWSTFFTIYGYLLVNNSVLCQYINALEGLGWTSARLNCFEVSVLTVTCQLGNTGNYYLPTCCCSTVLRGIIGDCYSTSTRSHNTARLSCTSCQCGYVSPLAIVVGSILSTVR